LRRRPNVSVTPEEGRIRVCDRDRQPLFDAGDAVWDGVVVRKTRVRVDGADFNYATHRVTVRLSDLDYEHLRIEFVYEGALSLEALELISVVVARKDARRRSDTGPEISAADLRDGFPWARWADAARKEAFEVVFDEALQAHRLGESFGDGPGVEEMYSDRDLFLMSIAEDYRRNVSMGVRDPVGQIARVEGVKPGTARTWIYRARQAGFLGPAKGPTPGEQSSSQQTAESPRPQTTK
jgi:hypothetical protein